MFFRLFHMNRDCFKELSKKIEEAVGDEDFNSEEYLKLLTGQGTSTPKGRMLHASKHATGEYVSGEWKLALTLRHLAGASYLDILIWSNVSANHIKVIVQHVFQHWICNELVIPIDFYKDVLGNKEKLHKVR